MCEAVSEDDMREIVQVMKQRAKEGDVAAAKLIFSYTVGRPAEMVNPDTLDDEEMRQYLRQPELAAGMPGVLQTIDPETCCDIVRVARPGMVGAMREQMAEAMFTGRVPGTGEQVAPPLDPRDYPRPDVTSGDAPPSANGDNGEAGAVGRRSRAGGGKRGGRGSNGRARPKARPVGRQRAAVGRAEGTGRAKENGSGRHRGRRVETTAAGCKSNGRRG
jgi:hypothetical protein